MIATLLKLTSRDWLSERNIASLSFRWVSTVNPIARPWTKLTRVHAELKRASHSSEKLWQLLIPRGFTPRDSNSWHQNSSWSPSCMNGEPWTMYFNVVYTLQTMDKSVKDRCICSVISSRLLSAIAAISIMPFLFMFYLSNEVRSNN